MIHQKGKTDGDYGVLVHPRFRQAGKEKSTPVYYKIGAFQTKVHWQDDADLHLIAHSVKMLKAAAERTPELRIDMNFPGIGNGKLTFDDVAPLLVGLPGNVHIWRKKEVVVDPMVMPDQPEQGKVIAVTGHRPKTLGYDSMTAARMLETAREVIRRYKPKGVITGMALGWDTAIAAACLEAGVPYIAAIPFVGQEARWRAADQFDYQRFLKWSEKVHVCSPGGYAASKMQTRNQWMVDQAELVVALWNGEDGGTSNCVRYAQAQNVPIHNAWDYFQNDAKTFRINKFAFPKEV
jgi:uncharacterized phage-like protein YoqJ